jgi:hypothetical protein
MNTNIKIVFIFLSFVGILNAFLWNPLRRIELKLHSPPTNSKHQTKVAIISTFLIPFICSLHTAGAIDPAELRKFAKPDQVILLGGSGKLEEKLKALQEAQTVLDAVDVPFTELSSGVSYRQYREGKGDREVKPGSIVTAEMTIRCKSFVTNSDPGGVQYYSTAKDAPQKSLTWQIGSGEFLPGLEEAMIGMKRSSIRRIEVPSVLVFAARDNNQLPLPSKLNDDGNRRFKNLFKTKADLLFEVLITKIVDPPNVIPQNDAETYPPLLL